MTEFIRAEQVLPEAEIAGIIRGAPANLVRFQDVAALVRLSGRPAMTQWLERFNAGRSRPDRYVQEGRGN